MQRRRHSCFPAADKLHGSNSASIVHNFAVLGSRLAHSNSSCLIYFRCTSRIVHIRLIQNQNSMEQGVYSFLRDLTEVRKTGLSPEKCIESLSTRDYGTFSKEIRKISSEISWGIPIKKVMMDFLHRTRSWMVQLVMFLLVETIDVGGGTIAMIESLARFNNLTQDVEKEKKMNVRPYVMMPYLASILLVATTVMMMSLTTGVGVGASGSVGPQRMLEASGIDADSIHDSSHLQQLPHWHRCGKNQRRIHCGWFQACSHPCVDFGDSCKIDSTIHQN